MTTTTESFTAAAVQHIVLGHHRTDEELSLPITLADGDGPVVVCIRGNQALQRSTVLERIATDIICGATGGLIVAWHDVLMPLLAYLPPERAATTIILDLDVERPDDADEGFDAPDPRIERALARIGMLDLPALVAERALVLVRTQGYGLQAQRVVRLLLQQLAARAVTEQAAPNPWPILIDDVLRNVGSTDAQMRDLLALRDAGHALILALNPQDSAVRTHDTDDLDDYGLALYSANLRADTEAETRHLRVFLKTSVTTVVDLPGTKLSGIPYPLWPSEPSPVACPTEPFTVFRQGPGVRRTSEVMTAV